MKRILFVVILLLPCFVSAGDNLDYWAWRKTLKPESKTAYFILKNTIICNTREKYIYAHNTIVQEGGLYSTKSIISRFSCSTMQGWSIARIIEKKEKSNVVKIEYVVPFSDSVTTRYTHTDNLYSLPKLKERQIE